MLDLDATDDPIHGTQEGRFFHGYYGNYCYMPLYIFAGDFLLAAKLRTSGIDAAAGAMEEVQRIVARIRERWPDAKLVLRADSGFARDDLMAWCEDTGVDFVFRLARNKRLEQMIAADLKLVRAVSQEERDGAPTRAYCELRYQTRDSWTRERRVVAKAEWLGDKHNPRFVVTSFCEQTYPAQSLYEELYCARGDMENRIKEQQLGLFADRTSAHTLRANQLRLWFASVAYVLLNLLRHFGLRGTEMERAQAGSLRLRLLKVAALVRVSVRRPRARQCPPRRAVAERRGSGAKPLRSHRRTAVHGEPLLATLRHQPSVRARCGGRCLSTLRRGTTAAAGTPHWAMSAPSSTSGTPRPGVQQLDEPVQRKRGKPNLILPQE